MRYFVVTQTGMYGPADTVQLGQWAEEGRLTPDTVLEEEGTGKRMLASTVDGILFTTFQQTPTASNIVVASSPPAGQSRAMQPIPPQIVSNYRRPDYQPPLFLDHQVDGRRELLYSFLLALGAPLIAVVHVYGVAVAFGGLYCAVVALGRGHKLAILSLLLNLAAVPAALFLHFGLHWLF